MRLLNLSPGGSSVADYALVAVGVVAVALVDYFSGTDIQVLSLYFVLVAYAGWRLGRLGATIVSFVLALVWVAMLFADGARYGAYTWLANFLAQAIAFLFVSNLVAVMARRLSQEQSISQMDPLTGLGNREQFSNAVSVALQRECAGAPDRPGVAVLFIDLDAFKPINDRYGHSAGDRILCTRFVYGTTRSLLVTVLGRLGIRVAA